jgi:BirA family biotin operon repressor/biotin-[acetyl-CoA-carboxylase] ligase
VSGAPARVLAALRRAGGRSCSGASLSRELGVSRAQVWKHVEALRARGYEIAGEPGGGYRLTGVPDRLYPEEIGEGLATRWLGRELHWYDEIDSTNRLALELARAGAPAGTAVVAESQTAGRGRLGRTFFSPPHQNLYVSIVLRPALSTAEAPTLILAAAVAVADAVAEAIGASSRVEIKWPNDVLVDGRKVSGILMELGAEAARVQFCVLGIGVNLNVDPADFPADFRAAATSLAAAGGRRLDRAAFTRSLFGALERTLEVHARGGFAGVRPAFESRFRMAGRRVRVRELDGSETAGAVRGIDADGALLVERADGRVERVVAGDVTLVKEGRAA